MKNYVVDTCDVTFRRLRDKQVIFTASAQLASINQTIDTQDVKGGIGSQTQFIVKSDKEVTLTVRDALFDRDWLEMSQGLSFEKGTSIVTKKEEGIVVTDGVATVKGETTEEKITLMNETGVSKEFELGDGEIEVSEDFATEGERLLAIYQIEVEGDILKIDGDVFPEAYEVEYHTIEYNKITDRIAKDIYFKFFNVSPDGELDLSFENGEPIAPEMSFTCLAAPNSSNIGEIVQVDHVEEGTP